MSRRKDRAEPPGLRRHPGLRTKIYVRDDMIGGGKVDLLARVAETGSITKAAKEMGMGYRRAWFLLETLQACFEAPLFETSRGGKRPGGTRVTELGRELIARFEAHVRDVDAAAAPFLEWMETHQRGER